MYSRDDFPDGAPVGIDPRSEPSPRSAKNAAVGFGSPGADATVKRIDLNDALISHPQATFLMRAAGNAMVEAGIADGDVLLVDRAIHAEPGHVVVTTVDGELVCRRLMHSAGQARLQSCGGTEADIVAADGAAPEIWGVVTTVIKSLLG
jgi:DNA polymerase V